MTDIEHKARELLAAEYERIGWISDAINLRSKHEDTAQDELAINAIVAALRQQPAPVDLEQFREAVECWRTSTCDRAATVINERAYYPLVGKIAVADRLLSIIDNAGKVAPACEVRLWDSQWVNIVNAPEVLDASDREEAVNAAVRMTERAIAQNVASSNLPPAPHQPDPVVDDAMVVERMAVWIAHLEAFIGPSAIPTLRASLAEGRSPGGAALARAQGVQS